MTGLLRTDVLNGLSVVLAAGPGGPRAGLARTVSALGARVVEFAPQLDSSGEGGAEWLAAQGPVQALVFDGSATAVPVGAAVASGSALATSEEEHDGLRELLDAAWIAVAAVANGAFIPANEGGRIILVAPGREPGGGGIAEVAASALENLARTLSVEWARYRVTVTAIAPAAVSAAEDLEMLVAYLLSPAGAYFSGTRLDLDLLRS